MRQMLGREVIRVFFNSGTSATVIIRFFDLFETDAEKNARFIDPRGSPLDRDF